VVGIRVSLGISLGIGLPLLASKVEEGSDLVDSAVGQSNGVDRMVGNGQWGMVGDGQWGMVGDGQWGVVVGKWGVVDDRGNVMEDRVGDHLVAHLSGHLNDRLDKRGVGDSVGHREDGSDRGHMVDKRLNCVGEDRGRVGDDGVCENRGRVGEKRGRVGSDGVCEKRGGVGGYWEGEGMGVCGMG